MPWTARLYALLYSARRTECAILCRIAILWQSVQRRYTRLVVSEKLFPQGFDAIRSHPESLPQTAGGLLWLSERGLPLLRGFFAFLAGRGMDIHASFEQGREQRAVRAAIRDDGVHRR